MDFCVTVPKNLFARKTSFWLQNKKPFLKCLKNGTQFFLFATKMLLTFPFCTRIKKFHLWVWNYIFKFCICFVLITFDLLYFCQLVCFLDFILLIPPYFRCREILISKDRIKITIFIIFTVYIYIIYTTNI